MKHRNYLLIVIFILALVVVPVTSLATSDRPLSQVERRPLAQAMTYQQYRESHYGADLSDYFAYQETYLLDQFPLRDDLRVLTAVAKVYGLRLRDSNLYYKVEGHLSKLDPVLHENAVHGAVGIFNEVCRAYFTDQGRHVFALVPDKNVFMAESGAYPHIPYESFLGIVTDKLDPTIQVLSLREHLSLDDYYRTDPHWDQKKLSSVSDILLQALKTPSAQDDTRYTVHTSPNYLGTYAGQAALPVDPDEFVWLTDETLNQAIVYDNFSKETSGIYQTDQLKAVDPYDIFLGGAKALLTIKNAKQTNGQQLVVFRDSYGSSMVPLLVASYSEVLVVDLRYVSMKTAATFVDISEDADVLFLYSTSVLNSPGAFMP